MDRARQVCRGTRVGGNDRQRAVNGTEARGLDAIREVWAGLVALGGRLDVTTRYVAETGDIALLSNQWTFEGDGTTASSVTAEVARRGADGAWRYVIDNPHASPADGG